MLYAGDHGDRFAPGCGASGYRSNYDIYLEIGGSGADYYVKYSYWTLLFANLLPQPRSLYCPSDSRYTYATHYPEGSTNGIWHGRVSYPFRGITPVHSGSNKDPVYIRWGNYNGPNRVTDPTQAMTADQFMGAVLLHANGYNVGYSDGSARSVHDRNGQLLEWSVFWADSRKARNECWSLFDQQ